MSLVDFMLTERQKKMLAALVLHPETQYRTNELLAIGGSGVGAGRAVIESFEKSGVVVRERRGNQLLYSINTANPIYPELRSIALKSFGMANVVAGELQPFEGRIELAFIFGSIVRDAARPDSDVDLMIVGDLDLFDLGSAIERMEKALGRKVDLNLHTPSEWAALQNDRVIGAVMREPKVILFARPRQE